MPSKLGPFIMHSETRIRVGGVVGLALLGLGCMSEIDGPLPFDRELFDARHLDPAEWERLSQPDPALDKGAQAIGFDGTQLFRVNVRAQSWSAQRLATVASDWKVAGVAVDPADPQMLYLLVADAEEGRYRLYRGTGRAEWTLMTAFRTSLPSHPQRQYARVPLSGLAASEEGLLFRAEYLELEVDGSPELSRSTLETYLVALDRPNVLPRRIGEREGALRSVEGHTQLPPYFGIRDIACTGEFTRRARTLGLLADEQNCSANPMATGSVNAALLHGAPSDKPDGRQRLSQALSRAQAVSALPDSRTLLLGSDGAVELFDAWLQAAPDGTYARLDAHHPTFLPTEGVSAPPHFTLLAGFERLASSCSLGPQHPLLTGLQQVLETQPTGAKYLATQTLRTHLSAGQGHRCPCETLSQATRALVAKAYEPSVVAEVASAIEAESSQRGCDSH